MSNELIISATQNGCRIALLKDKNLAEFHHEEEGSKFLVGDIYSQNIARKIFKNIKITLIKNPYFKEIELQINKLKKSIKKKKGFKKILYLTEPLRDQAKYLYNNSKYYGYDEFSALNNFLKYLLLNKKFLNFKFINIRFHPSENKIKYSKILTKYKKLKIKISNEKNLINDLLLSDFVIGCETTALVVALIAKKKVFCSIPKNGKKSTLPYKNIMHISKLRNYLNA